MSDAELKAMETAWRLAKRSSWPGERDGFVAGWKAGVEWAEEHGESSMVRWFVEAEASALEAQRLAAEPDVGDQGQLND